MGGTHGRESVMGVKSMASKQEGPTAAPSDYVRFLVLAQARSGSNMLAMALNSSASITCFGEIFNFAFDGVMFGGVEGYDHRNAKDRALRDNDFQAFLRERIYCQHPEEIGAVGWKLLYRQFWGYPGLLQHLIEHRHLRVLHLKRRNLLRALLSLKIAETTGVWMEVEPPRLTLANVRRASRHPFRTVARLPRLLGRVKGARKRFPPPATRTRLTVTKEELDEFIIWATSNAAHYDNLFRGHPMQTLFYEDLVDRRDKTFRQAQEFLGVKPGPLTVRLVKQNPEPLPELLENYDELRAAYLYSKHAWMFD